MAVSGVGVDGTSGVSVRRGLVRWGPSPWGTFLLTSAPAPPYPVPASMSARGSLMPGWSFSDIPDLDGRTAVVTGGNAGLGFRSSLELARKGARVFLACRSPERGRRAVGRIQAELPAARVDAVALDLTSSASIERCAERIASHTERLDILLNNAAVVNLEMLQRTAAGHEMHMATNHFGPGICSRCWSRLRGLASSRSRAAPGAPAPSTSVTWTGAGVPTAAEPMATASSRTCCS